MSVAELTAKTRIVKKQLLHKVSGVVKSGTMTLVPGQPGSGKSSLLKLLSGRLAKDKNVKVKGQVSYNGAPQEELLTRLPQFVSYVSQYDNHLPTLTVKETLEFANACNGGEENTAALEIIQQLGLENCQDTIVGDAMLRGVSGGERKRVTLGKMAFGKNYVETLDEISTGLDSAATFDIISTQRSLIEAFHKTMVISLLQPPPEVFALFDDVILLNEGYLMYHGSRSQVQDYFESLGFKCPPQRDVADFLLDLGTDKQYQYEIGIAPRTTQDYAELFEKSDIHQQTLEDLHTSMDSTLIYDREQHIAHEQLPEFQRNVLAETNTLLARETKLLLRNMAAIKTRLVMAVGLGLMNGSTFYQFDAVNSQVVMGIAFSAINTLSLAQGTLIPQFLSMRDVLYKQRRANFFRVSSYTIASSVSQIPLVFVESMLFGTLTY